MSEENLELVRRGVDDVQAFWAMLDEHVVWDLRKWETLDLDPVYTGRDAVVEGSRRYWGAWDEYSVEPVELIDAGQTVFVLLHERGVGKGSRAPVEREHPQLWTFHVNVEALVESAETGPDDSLVFAGHLVGYCPASWVAGDFSLS